MLASSGTIASNEDCADLPLEHQGVESVPFASGTGAARTG